MFFNRLYKPFFVLFILHTSVLAVSCDAREQPIQALRISGADGKVKQILIPPEAFDTQPTWDPRKDPLPIATSEVYNKAYKYLQQHLPLGNSDLRLVSIELQSHGASNPTTEKWWFTMQFAYYDESGFPMVDSDFEYVVVLPDGTVHGYFRRK